MTNPIRVTIHQAGSGVCSLSGKDGDGLCITFEDGTLTQQHLSWKSFRQLVAMKTAQAASKPAPKPLPVGIPSPATAVATGNAVAK